MKPIFTNITEAQAIPYLTETFLITTAVSTDAGAIGRCCYELSNSYRTTIVFIELFVLNSLLVLVLIINAGSTICLLFFYFLFPYWVSNLSAADHVTEFMAIIAI